MVFLTILGPPQAPRHVWTREEKAALERQFPLEIKLGKTPGQLKCQTAINSEKKHWLHLVGRVSNMQ